MITCTTSYKYPNDIMYSAVERFNADFDKATIEVLKRELGISKKKEPTIAEKEKMNKAANDRYRAKIKNVFFNGKKGATTVEWHDGTFTVVKVADGDHFDPYIGVALCMAKKLYDNKPIYNEIIEHWGDTYSKSEEDVSELKLAGKKYLDALKGENVG